MVDRSAPWVLGAYLAGRSLAPLHELAVADESVRRLWRDVAQLIRSA